MAILDLVTYQHVEEISEGQLRALRNRVNGALVHMPKGRRLNLTAWRWSDVTATAEAERLYGPHNPDHVSLATYNLMRLDWTIGLALEIWRTAFTATEYWVEGPSTELNSFVEQLWRRQHRQWIRVFLNALAWGYSVSEIVWALRDVVYQFRNRNGTLVTKRKLGAFWLEDLRDYDPRGVILRKTVERGDYAGFRLADQDNPFAPEETVHVVFCPEFGSITGRPLTHRSYSPWWWGNATYLALNHYLERKGDPPITGYAPSEKTIDEDGNAIDPIDLMSVAAANLRMGASYIMPGELDPVTNQRLYELREMQVAQRAEEFLPVLQHYEALKALGTLTSPELTGATGQGGAFAKAKVSRRQQHNMFTETQDGVIIEPFNRQMIPAAIRANFGQVRDSDLPMLRGGRLSENAQDVIAELVKDSREVLAITRTGKIAPVGSLIDWESSIRQIGLPTVDEEAIPDDLQPQPRDTPGQPSDIAANPERPEGDTERGLDRPAFFQRDLSAMTAEQWFELADAMLTQMDAQVSRADAAVAQARRSMEASIRKVLDQAIKGATTTRSAEGVLIFDARNRTLAKTVRGEVEAELNDTIVRLLDEKEIEAAEFQRTPLAISHTRIARAANDWLEELSLPVPSPIRSARIVKDVTRDGQTNALAVPTREARRVQEILDRMIQSGEAVEFARDWAQSYTLPDRDLRLSTVSHVRGTARAILGSEGVVKSQDVGGWIVMSSPGARQRLADDFPKGRVAKMMFRTFNNAGELDAHFQGMLRSTGQPGTSWKNLGLHFFSEEYYLPVHLSVWPLVAALAIERREEWNRRRRDTQVDLDAEGGELGRALPDYGDLARPDAVARLRALLAEHGEPLRAALKADTPPGFTRAEVVVAMRDHGAGTGTTGR